MTWDDVYTATVDILVDKPFPSVTQTGDEEWTGSCKLGNELFIERGPSKRGVRRAIFHRWVVYHLGNRVSQLESA